MRQTTLFDKAHTRRRDPLTSFKAADSVKNIRASQRYILRLFRRYGAMSDETLVRIVQRDNHPVIRMSESGIRTRRNELVALGYVHASNRRERTRSGRTAIVWVSTHRVT